MTKRLDLARELVPTGSIIAVLVNLENQAGAEEGRAAQAAAAALGESLLLLNASTPSHLDDAFATMKREQARAVIISSDPFFFNERAKLIVLMARDRMPAIFGDREQAEAGTSSLTAPAELMRIGKPATTSAGSSREKRLLICRGSPNEIPYPRQSQDCEVVGY